jgi:hypothetical protein
VILGFALIGYYGVLSELTERRWTKLMGQASRNRFPWFMALGLVVAIVYAGTMTNWDWDLRYLWSACTYFP